MGVLVVFVKLINYMNPLTPTEIEGLRISIAEEMGWKAEEILREVFISPTHTEIRRVGFTKPAPYTTSIDAIQKAAMERFKSLDQAYLFEGDLLVRKAETKTPFEHQLTALDWCIAFARTAKIWRYQL